MMHDALTGVQYELQDCALPTLKGIIFKSFHFFDYKFIFSKISTKFFVLILLIISKVSLLFT